MSSEILGGRETRTPLSCDPASPAGAETHRLLSSHRSEDSYLAGGAAVSLSPNTQRYSNDLDFFHDSVERVAAAFNQDRELLTAHRYAVVVDMNQPGHIRATVELDPDRTKVEWARDSAWRFMPTLKSELAGYLLHPVDLAVNKVLALAGRDEARDLPDIMTQHETVLS